MKVLLGFGLGLFVASLLFMVFKPGRLSDFQIEQRARQMGMVYKNEIVIINENGVEKADQAAVENTAD